MASLFLNAEEQGVVVFKLWKSLDYKKRLLISSAFILTGLVWQVISGDLFPGVVLLLGNLLLLPSGYDQRVKIGTYKADADWEKVTLDKLHEFLDLIKKIKKWDRSSLDITSALGVLTFLVMLGGLAFLFYQSEMIHKYRYLAIVSLDAAVLYFPFWFSGLRLGGVGAGTAVAICQQKIRITTDLAEQEETKALLGDHGIDFFVLLKGKEVKQPIDVKLRVNILNRHADFLGLYGQIVTNTVQNTPYMYFYMVLVAKKGFGLKAAYDQFQTGKTLVKEFKVQQDVEVFVIRQDTTRVTRGYCTTPKQMRQIYAAGIQAAEAAAVK